MEGGGVRWGETKPVRERVLIGSCSKMLYLWWLSHYYHNLMCERKVASWWVPKELCSSMKSWKYENKTRYIHFTGSKPFFYHFKTAYTRCIGNSHFWPFMAFTINWHWHILHILSTFDYNILIYCVATLSIMLISIGISIYPYVVLHFVPILIDQNV